MAQWHAHGWSASRATGVRRTGRAPCHARRHASRLDDSQGVLGQVERARATHGGRHNVLDADAKAALHVNARFHRKDVASSNRRRIAGDHVRVLVLLEADPVACAVQEILAEPGIGDHPARDAQSTPLHSSPTCADTTPAAWASATTPYTFAISREGGPVKTVLVMSEQ